MKLPANDSQNMVSLTSTYYVFFHLLFYTAVDLQEKENRIDVVKSQLDMLTQGTSEVAVCTLSTPSSLSPSC